MFSFNIVESVKVSYSYISSSSKKPSFIDSLIILSYSLISSFESIKALDLLILKEREGEIVSTIILMFRVEKYFI